MAIRLLPKTDPAIVACVAFSVGKREGTCSLPVPVSAAQAFRKD
jgi:hypothetical protein